MMLRLFAAAVLALFCTAAHAAKEYRFSGEFVGDPEVGFGVMGEKKGAVVAVTNRRDHYALILPWTEDWVFSLGEKPLLTGKSGLVNMTLHSEACDETPELHLKTLQTQLDKSGGMKGAEKAEIISFRNQPVLRVLVDAAAATGKGEFKGVKMIHLRFAKRWEKTVYVLHLSRVIPPDEVSSFDEKPLLNCGTVGFNVDFNREAAKPAPEEKKAASPASP